MQLIIMAASFFLVLLAFFLLMRRGVSVAIHLGNWNFLTLKFEFCQENILFSLVLMIIVLSVLAYSMFYIEGELYFSYYGFITLLFVTSMLGLNFSGNTLLALLSWDLLGISRFFLILYYNNWESCNGAMSTIMTNRLGDFFLFAFFASMFMRDASFWAISNFHLLVPMLLVLGCMTKRAQFPFRSWLPKAMRAPTPISSLVHRRTLVTAGLLLLMKFSEVLYTSFMITFLRCVGLLTMLFARLAALVEQDLKKVVALRTLSQIGFAFMTLGMGIVGLTQLHLVSHALFKSCLFMQIGYLIHISIGQQDPRGMMGVCETVPVVVQLQTVATLFCLTGLFFLRGAVRKDMILERGLSRTYSIAFFVIYVLAIFLTFCYRLKLWNGFLRVFGGTCYVYSTSLLMNYLALPLVLLSIGFIW